MKTYQTQIRMSRRRALWRIFSRQGIVLTLRITSDADFIATVDDKTPLRPSPRWHEPDETWP